MRKRNFKENVKHTVTSSAPEEVKEVEREASTTIESEVNTLKESEILVLSKLREAHKALVSLSSKRLESKLSNTRVVGVARELNELIKVMAVYEGV